MNKTLRALATCLLTLSLFSHSLTACINTSYSRADEVEITDELLPLILGAFPHHGKAFYEQELIRTRKILDAQPDDFDARNDLGAAYTKLEQWDLAQAEFEKNEKLHSGRYETASNLGVMYKKKGDFEQAEKYISKALEIKPGGHMGLGDYYLKMIQWLGGVEKLRENKNFLGVRYDEGPKASAQVANEEFIVTLIKNDYQFIDAYTVLGDILFSRGDYQLALRAYHRTLNLSESAIDANSSYYDNMIVDRIQNITAIWKKKKTDQHVIENHPFHPIPGHIQITREFDDSAKWLRQFQNIEDEFLSSNRLTTFESLMAEMDKRGINTPTILEAVYYKGTEDDGLQSIRRLVMIVTTIFFILVAFLVFFLTRYIIRTVKRRRADQPA